MNRVMECCCLASYPRWIDLSTEDYPDHYLCSNCGEAFDGEEPPEYCPNCGEKMKCGW